MLERMQNPRGEVSIGLVGKYVEYEDSYKSLKEALLHGGLAHEVKVNIHWIEAEGVEGPDWERQLEGFDGILVPGGFGKRGIEGMLNAIRYARERKVPYFGICLGMQTMVIEFARNVCGLEHANSTEFDPGTPHRVIYKLRELKGVDELGGTMRLGAGRASWPKAASRARPTARGDQRTAPPSLRIQSRIRRAVEAPRAADHRRNAGRHVRRDLRDRRTIPGFWAASSIPSSSRSRWSRIRCSRRSSARRYEHRREAAVTEEAVGAAIFACPLILAWRLISRIWRTASRWR